MVEEKSWKELIESGLLWWINKSLHLFGWAIVVEIDEHGEIRRAYPARVKYRGFDENTNTQGFIILSDYLKENAEQLSKESRE